MGPSPGRVVTGTFFGNNDPTNAYLSECIYHTTIFVHVDLSTAHGLGSANHNGPAPSVSTRSFDRRARSPKSSSAGAACPNTSSRDQRALAGSIEPIQFYSCFISYSTADQEFASRLNKDFEAAGIRCWKWDHDARIRSKPPGRDRPSDSHEREACTNREESSLKSPAVNREIERAIVQEDERLKLKGKGGKEIDADVLFPVTLDRYIFGKWKHERKVDVTKKVIADAKGWDSDAGIYAKVRDKLIRDLKAEASAGLSRASHTRWSTKKASLAPSPAAHAVDRCGLPRRLGLHSFEAYSCDAGRRTLLPESGRTFAGDRCVTLLSRSDFGLPRPISHERFNVAEYRIGCLDCRLRSLHFFNGQVSEFVVGF